MVSCEKTQAKKVVAARGVEETPAPVTKVDRVTSAAGIKRKVIILMPDKHQSWSLISGICIIQFLKTLTSILLSFSNLIKYNPEGKKEISKLLTRSINF